MQDCGGQIEKRSCQTMQRAFKSRQSRRQFLTVAGGATLSGLVWLGHRQPQPAAVAELSNDDAIIVNGWVLAAGDLEVESGAL